MVVRFVYIVLAMIFFSGCAVSESVQPEANRNFNYEVQKEYPEFRRRPVADYGAHPNERMMDLSNMNPFPDDCNRVAGEGDCYEYSFTGRIIKVIYADDGMTIRGLVVVSDPGDRAYLPDGSVNKLGGSEGNNRSYVNIAEELKSSLSMVDLGYLPTLLKEGRQVRVWVNVYGAAGRIEVANRVKAIN
jgi:hypothetical protein